MNEVQVIKRNDTSDVPKYLKMILDSFANGIPYEKLREKHKYLPHRATILDWIRKQPESVRQEINNMRMETRSSGAEVLDERAMSIAMEPVYDAEDATIKEKQVKMLLMVSRRIAPRDTKETPDLEKTKEADIVSETEYPSMTAEQAKRILESKRAAR